MLLGSIKFYQLSTGLEEICILLPKLTGLVPIFGTNVNKKMLDRFKDTRPPRERKNGNGKVSQPDTVSSMHMLKWRRRYRLLT